MFYLDATLEVGATFDLPAQYEERAVYVTEGEIEVEGSRYGPGQRREWQRGGFAPVPGDDERMPLPAQ